MQGSVLFKNFTATLYRLYTGDYIDDEHGDNLFDSEHEAQKLMTIARMQEAIINMFRSEERRVGKEC